MPGRQHPLTLSLWIALVLVQACVPSVPLSEVLQDGHDNPRAREHEHTDDRIAVTGIVQHFEKEVISRGYRFEQTGGNFSGVSGTVRPDEVTYYFVDIRALDNTSGYARCRFRLDDIEDAERLKIGDRTTMVGYLKEYSRTPQGLMAFFDHCKID
ncbi:MAG: hypothetical protein PVI30_03190 [Myxococcales bacterium]|jgi:hypothetical protein